VVAIDVTRYSGVSRGRERDELQRKEDVSKD
jgi:hypothetical protein